MRIPYRVWKPFPSHRYHRHRHHHYHHLTQIYYCLPYLRGELPLRRRELPGTGSEQLEAGLELAEEGGLATTTTTTTTASDGRMVGGGRHGQAAAFRDVLIFSMGDDVITIILFIVSCAQVVSSPHPPFHGAGEKNGREVHRKHLSPPPPPPSVACTSTSGGEKGESDR